MLDQFALKNKLTRNWVLAVFVLVLATACTHVAPVSQGMLKDHTPLGSLDAEALASLNAMNKEAGPDYFNSPSNYQVINGFKIFYQKGRQEILITRNGKVVAKVDNEALIAYKDVPEAPSIGTERVEIFSHGISYGGDVYTIYDFGFDGPDVRFKTAEPEKSESSIDAALCRNPVSLAPGVACCQEGSSGAFVGYVFDLKSGWKKSINNTILTHRCESIR